MWESTEYLAYQFPHLHLEYKMLPKERGMLGSRVLTLEVWDTSSSANNPSIDAVSDSSRQPHREDRHATLVVAPAQQPVNQPSILGPSEAPIIISAHSVATEGQARPAQPNETHKTRPITGPIQQAH